MSAELGNGKVIATSDGAVLIDLTELGQEVWIPRSIITDDSEIEDDAEKGVEGEVAVKTWWAEKEGLV